MNLYPQALHAQNPWHLLHHERKVVAYLKRRIAALRAAAAAPAPSPSSAPAATVGGSVRAFLLCIHPYEEPSWSTVAGGLGFVSPPSSYNVGNTDALAAQYGDSWSSWPEEAQLAFGAALYAAYGSSPWSTAYHCT